MAHSLVFIDTEIAPDSGRILDLGALREDGSAFHSSSLTDFLAFIADADFVCGHNVLRHDLKYLEKASAKKLEARVIDTLPLSPLLFPRRPYHSLLKDDKLQVDELNNPLNDCRKARVLFHDEVNAYLALPEERRAVYRGLLSSSPSFRDFFVCMDLVRKTGEGTGTAETGSEETEIKATGTGETAPRETETVSATASSARGQVSRTETDPARPDPAPGGLHRVERVHGDPDNREKREETEALAALIRKTFAGRICSHADLLPLILNTPEELAFALALIGTEDPCSVTPPWALHTWPAIGNVVRLLRHTPCREGCDYCRMALDVRRGLKEIFGFTAFRTYNGEPLQEKAARAAVEGQSLLAVFPTGGGKSVTFQLPALMAGQCEHGLTVVISPLQSLMKDQVDNLESAGITEAVTVNGLLDPVERASALARVADGSASLVYISPELLRSRTMEKVLSGRRVVRFVIDEAHCFSAWGQDFRVDYQYIGHFIKELQERTGRTSPIPVSCFTATAKQKVISDIRDYFARVLGLDLRLFASSATRENLHYTVLYKETDREKYEALRGLLAQRRCPTIVYVSTTKRTRDLAERLTEDGFPALPFNGKMDADEKVRNQEAFMTDGVGVVVATSAFGMGVDKKDVGLVVHYDISASLEDYVQEAGRAGRDPSLRADCYVLYNDGDLDRHFLLLNRTKLSMSEIQQVWTAIKELTRQRPRVCCSPLEIARAAGWEDHEADVETRVKTAVAALEHAGYVKRGRNVPHVYATSILEKSMLEAGPRIDAITSVPEEDRLNAKRIMTSLMSSRSRARGNGDEAESRIDWLADRLGLDKREVIRLVNLMREEGLLADDRDMSAYIPARGGRRALDELKNLERLEAFLLERVPEEGTEINLKELNEEALAAGLAKSCVRTLRTLVNALAIAHWVDKSEDRTANRVRLVPKWGPEVLMERHERRSRLCRFIVTTLSAGAGDTPDDAGETVPVHFSVLGLLKGYRKSLLGTADTRLAEVEDALLHLSKTGVLQLEGGFLVLYNAMEINRVERSNRARYKKEDYRFLDEYYRQKVQQIHIVGHYANLVVRDYDAALRFVRDYFQMDYRKFIATYFRGERAEEIRRTISKCRYEKLFGQLSDTQRRITGDGESKRIVVAAGPGSGKTRVLVHKLASLLLMEDVKSEQLLMLTFSRAAATEFQKRLCDLIGPAARYVDIRTFHSYAFEILGRLGSVEGSDDVVARAVRALREGEAEPSKTCRTVLVVDEAQDMAADEYDLVRALMERNEGMRVIAVGDDDQNIFAFRGSDSRYLGDLASGEGAAFYEMTENFRSGPTIVALANAFAKTMGNRMKKAPIVAGRDVRDRVTITRYATPHMEEAVVRRVAEEVARKPSVARCVLTQTNDEALQVTGLLLRHGVRARLVQSLDGFRLSDLVEVRFFLRQLDLRRLSPVLSDEVWEMAKQKLVQSYGRSACLPNCLRLLKDFEATHAEKHRTDLDEFIRESAYDDFFEDDRATVIVSTIHKAKGREYDAVHLLLNGCAARTDEERRKLYVGMTRAKDELHIHCNTGFFDAFDVPGVERLTDTRPWPEPSEIILQLTHRDVVLSAFKGRKRDIFRLRAGDPLAFTENGLVAEIDGCAKRVVLFSKACQARLKELADRGYGPHSASVRFVVAWKGREDTEESAVLLPDLVLRRTGERTGGADEG